MAEHAEPAVGADEAPAVQGEVVRRAPVHVMRSRLPRDLRALRERVSELAQNPAAVATATVVTGLALNAVRDVVKSGALSRDAAAVPVALTGQVVHHVHVWHHVVHHVHHVYRPTAVVVVPPPAGR